MIKGGANGRKTEEVKTPFRFYDKHPYLGVILEIVVAYILIMPIASVVCGLIIAGFRAAVVIPANGITGYFGSDNNILGN